ncbi:alanine dehydrogenase [Oceanospirillaceae bacterium]|jgi:alanine dehydrogenase|nr:alanine dehydrogenase [Oceanospirillaceae bacterium]MBT5629823.1 alanine dehydrogenase [Oceanospirillaceae bacterium]MDC0085148.1 alanine dehydrogenase [Oceanospirillaceae bacterium]MDC1350729.1 alanine dehydrogenase [Oceanospirillaceae bacterium]
MLIGVPKEIKNHEYRVGMTPASVRELNDSGHLVMVETLAGNGIGSSDKDYIAAGAEIVNSAAEIYARAEMIVKVKEPQASERAMLRPQQLLFTYLHLAPDAEQTHDLIASGATCIAYETITSAQGGLPLLAPMSEVAGRMSIQAGAHVLEKAQGGRGMLLGGVPGVAPAKVVIIGGGVVGSNAAQMALGARAQVTVLDRSTQALARLDKEFNGAVKTVYSTQDSLEEYVLDADLVIGGVLIPGAAAPKLVTEAMVKAMKMGSVLVDVAIDQGGCFATSKATTHEDPTYVVDGVVHYCVANMPGGVAMTSTYALNNATLPYIMKLANVGWKKALQQDVHFLAGLNVHAGKVTNKHVAEALGYDYVPPETVVTDVTAQLVA